MIKSFLAPYELYIWAAVAVLLLLGGIFEVHRLENIGVQREQAHEAALAAAQAIHKEEVEARANQLNQTAGSQLHIALVAPDPVSSVIVRVCPDTPAARLVVPADGSAVPGGPSNPAAVLGPVADGGATQGLDIAPATEALLKRADAEIAYWRNYYTICKAQGICK